MELIVHRYSVYVVLDNALIYLQIVINIFPIMSTLTGVLHSSFKDILNQLCTNAYL